MIGRDVRVSGELANTDIAMNGVFRPGLAVLQLDASSTSAKSSSASTSF